MHKIRQFYYQNKTQIKIVIAIIAFIIIAIQFTNYMSRINSEKKIQESIVNNINNNKTENKNQIISEKSAVTGENINNTILNSLNQLIQEFITQCNNKDIEKAYNLLSEECKELNYKDVQAFKTLYYDKVFNNITKIATIENWINNTYKVTITDDSITTGSVSNNKKQDYITVVKQENELKLNINSFVDSEEINEQKTMNNISFKIINRNIYMDYEEYKIQIENKTNNTILLDTQKNPKTIYLEDENNVKYYSYSNEIIGNLLKVNKGFSTQITIKFGRKYSSIAKKINSVVFSDVLLNNSEKSNRTTIKVGI